MDTVTCSVCSSSPLREFSTFPVLKRVTSDAKPFPAGGHLAQCLVCGTLQKPNDAIWLGETSAIYEQYTIYNQESCGEPVVFQQGAKTSRSEYVLNHVCQIVNLPSDLSVLDVGTGTGVFLGACASRFPRGRFYGYDLDDKYATQLSKIPGFQKLFVDSLESIEEVFDFITLSHCLEHVPVPRATLRQLRKLLKPSGVLLIQVPDASRNPFDLLVADHRTHFEQASLTRLLISEGFSCLNEEYNWKATELSVIAKPLFEQEESPDLSHKEPKHWDSVIEFLKQTATLALSIKEPVAVWGTGIGAAWLYGYLGNTISFFVDEDTGRVGSYVLGLAVKHPSELTSDTPLLGPLPPIVLNAIQKRWGHLNFHEKYVPVELLNKLISVL